VFAHLPDAPEPAWRALAVAQLRGSARTAMVSVAAVLVSFGLMVAMAIMVHSFRESLDDWMQRILPADLYLRSGSGTQSAYFDEDAQRRIAAVPGLERVEFVRFRNVAMPGGGLPLTVIARPMIEREAAQHLPLRRTDLNPAPPGTLPVWASEAAFDLRGLAPGTVFELPLEGRVVRCSVRGLWRDYDRSGGSIVMDAADYRRLTGDTRANNAALWLAPGADPEATAAAVRAALASDERYELAWPGEIRRLSLQAFDRTFLVTYLIEAVAVLIGLFGIAASTSSQVLARRGEFGMLRHLGLTRREIARMLGFEGAALGTLGVLLGLVAGVLISLVLVYVVNRQSFHWTMDLHVPWGLLALLSAALIAAAALASVLSGRQAMGEDVVRAVKEDW
jgi:putative ABC transport system permease protein